jgi:hypothetical protein
MMVARDPSASVPGPGVLLVRESALRAALERAGCEIIWTVLGCREIIGEHPAIPEALHLNGAFGYREGKITGKITPTRCT